jgi:CheY-like chemotaxis protein
MQLTAQPFNLSEAIHEIAYAFTTKAAEKGIAIREDISLSNELVVIGDKFRLKQMLFNLTSNAVKFTNKGRVVITAAATFKPNEEVEIKIQVADSGVGIPAHHIQSIFEEFSQVSSPEKANESRRSIRGTGLGLPICKMLAELQGGKIQVDSRPNEGSVFTLFLVYPIQKDAVVKTVPIDNVPPKADQLFTGKRALVIEDNELNAMLLGLLLKKQQILFDFAKDGQAGWELFNENKYDIILTDINVPKLTGDQLANAIRNHPNGKSKLPVIALTANIMQDDLDDYRNSGISDILVKPFKENELKDMLQKHIYPN